MKCKKCGSENISIMFNMLVSMDSNYYRAVTKKSLREKNTQLWSVDWKDCDFICKDCGYTLSHNSKN